MRVHRNIPAVLRHDGFGSILDHLDIYFAQALADDAAAEAFLFADFVRKTINQYVLVVCFYYFNIVDNMLQVTNVNYILVKQTIKKTYINDFMFWVSFTAHMAKYFSAHIINTLL